MVVTIGYTGLRLGETIGLELDFVGASELQVEWRLREISGRFYRLPPKTTPTAASARPSRDAAATASY